MLGKLIKHEWKNVYKVGCLLLGAMALVTFFGWLSFQAPMWKSISGGGGHFSWLDIFGAFTLVMYMVMLAAVNLSILIYAGVRFYKTMYTDEGYLLHTLPVTKHEILLSKLLVNGFWVVAVILSMYLSLLLLGMAMVSALLPKGYTIMDLWREYRPEIGTVLALLGVELGIDFNFWFVLGILSTFVTPFVTLATLFGAISIGQLASKYRVLTAILSYVGITIVESMISSLFRSMLLYSSMSSFGAYVDTTALSDFIVRLVVAVALYFVSWHVSNRKLNLE